MKELTLEQIILKIIMKDIEYEELPRLILYEYFLTIKGEKIVFRRKKFRLSRIYCTTVNKTLN